MKRIKIGIEQKFFINSNFFNSKIILVFKSENKTCKVKFIDYGNVKVVN